MDWNPGTWETPIGVVLLVRFSPILALVLAAAVLAAIAMASVPADAGRFGPVWEAEGLAGFVRLPSVVAIQVSVVALVAVVVPLGLGEARRREARSARRCLSVAGRCAIPGLAGYLVSVGGIAWVSRAGMFGMGPAGLIVLFVLLPSLLLVGMTIVATVVGYVLLAVPRGTAGRAV
jgi:hypothetical protein